MPPLRQSCADGGHGAREIASRFDKLPDISLSSKWQAAVLVGDRQRAISLLKPLDQPQRLTTLMQYLVYPMFDARAFPMLQARLDADGVRRPPPITVRYACKP